MSNRLISLHEALAIRAEVLDTGLTIAATRLDRALASSAALIERNKLSIKRMEDFLLLQGEHSPKVYPPPRGMAVFNLPNNH